MNISVTTPVTGIKVKTATGLVLDGDGVKDAVITPGGSIKLTPLLSGAKTSIGNVKPSDTKVEWTSAGPDIVSVTSKGVLKCAKKTSTGGTAVITCAAKDGSGLSISFTVKVVPRAKKLAEVKDIVLWSVHRVCYMSWYKAETKASVKCPAGGSIKISQLGNGTLESFYKVTKSKTERIRARFKDQYGNYRYDMMIRTSINAVTITDEVKAQLPKNSNALVKSRTKYGTPDEIVFSKAGTYTLKIVTIDGSNKTFKLNVVVD